MSLRLFSLFLFLMSTLIEAAVFVPVSLRKQIQESSAIAKGVIEGSTSKILNGSIVTEYVLKTSQVAGLPASETEITFLQPGGVVGEKGSLVSGSVEFKAGEEVLVLLKNSQDKFWLQSLGLGKYIPFKDNNKTFYKSVIFPNHPELGKITEETLSSITKEKYKFFVKTEINNEGSKSQKVIYELKPHIKRKIASVDPEKANNSPFFIAGIGFLFLLGMWLLKSKEENE